MQNPIPDEGTYSSSSYFKTYAEEPDPRTLRVYMSLDAAVSEGRGDYTAIVVAAQDPEGRLLILDLYRAQASTDVWIDALLDRVLKYKPQVLVTESGAIKSAVGPFLKQRMRARKAYVAVETFPARHDKSVRAQSIRGIAAVQGIWLPQGAPWRENYVQMVGFPNSRNDDVVDCMSLLGQIISKMAPGDPLPVEKPRKTLESCTLIDLFKANERRNKRGGRIW